MSHLILYIAKLLAWIFKILPTPLRLWLGDLIGLLWFDVFRIRRRVSIENSKIAFPLLSEKKLKMMVRRSVCNLGRGLTEMILLPTLNKEWVEQNVVFENLELFHKACEKKKGVLLLSAHLGNGDMAISAAALKGIPLQVITKRFSIGALDRFWFDIRSSHGAKFIEARQSAFEILRALRQNFGVVFVLDQWTGIPIGIPATFFGKVAGTAYGLALFSEKTRAPVLGLYTVREDNGITRVIFTDEIPLEEKATRDETVAHMTQVYNNVLEGWVRKYPEQWLWIHRRWKEFS